MSSYVNKKVMAALITASSVLLLVVSFWVVAPSPARPGVYLGTVDDSSRVDPASIQGVPGSLADLDTHALAQFLVSCSLVRVASVDPIVGSVHEHAFFGNREVGVGPLSSVRDAMTSCSVPTDTASYWVPTIVDGKKSVAPDRIVAYYRKGIGVTTSDITAYPRDLFMIAGPSTDGRTAFWKCESSPLTSVEIPACPVDDSLVMVVVFPDCWDGRQTDTTGHRDHVRYSSSGVCPEGYPKHIPQLLLKVIYNPTAYRAEDYSLSSGGTLPHADFLNVWDQEELEKQVRTCLVRDQACPRH